MQSEDDNKLGKGATTQKVSGYPCIESDCLCLALLVSSEAWASGLDKHRGQLSE
jgi:hypothetical protein